MLPYSVHGVEFPILHYAILHHNCYIIYIYIIHSTCLLSAGAGPKIIAHRLHRLQVEVAGLQLPQCMLWAFVCSTHDQSWEKSMKSRIRRSDPGAEDWSHPLTRRVVVEGSGEGFGI